MKPFDWRRVIAQSGRVIHEDDPLNAEGTPPDSNRYSAIFWPTLYDVDDHVPVEHFVEDDFRLVLDVVVDVGALFWVVVVGFAVTLVVVDDTAVGVAAWLGEPATATARAIPGTVAAASSAQREMIMGRDHGRDPGCRGTMPRGTVDKRHSRRAGRCAVAAVRVTGGRSSATGHCDTAHVVPLIAHPVGACVPPPRTRPQLTFDFAFRVDWKDGGVPVSLVPD
jgi:hypothetical protein